MCSLDNLLSCSIPIISALTWAMIMMFAVRDSVGRLEKQVKTVLIGYFLVIAFNWVSLTIYIYKPEFAPYVNVAMLCLIIPSVLFYHFVYLLTITKREDSFSKWHYAPPLMIGLVLQVWSFFVPESVEIDLFKGRGAIIPGYEAYSYFSLSKPQLRLVFSGIYTCLVVFRIRKYYRETGKNNGLIRKPQRWFILLISLAVTIFLFSLVGILLPREQVFSPIVVVNYMIRLALHITIGYNVIRRNFLLYIPLQLWEEPKVVIAEPDMPINKDNSKGTDFGKRAYKRHTPMHRTVAGKIEYEKLTKPVFEAYIKKHKPYLNPKLKMADLLEPLQTNRSILSGFINQTYGVNFNCYFNRLRIRELKRLRLLSANAKKEDEVLIIQAGFASRRHYTQALAMDKKVRSDNHNNQ